MITRRSVIAGSAALVATDAKANSAAVLIKPTSKPSIKHITVFFATNRNQISPSDFGADFRDSSDGALYVTGTAEVYSAGGSPHPVWTVSSINVDPLGPVAEAEGSNAMQVEAPASVAIKAFIAASPQPLHMTSGRRAAKILYIPGFNSSFLGAMSVAAELCDGYGAAAVYCFSWPSMGKFGLDEYKTDQEHAYRSGKAIAKELVALFGALNKSSPGFSLHFVCHSMGNRALSAAIQTIVAQTSIASLLRKSYFEKALLFAADEDASAFSDSSKLAPFIPLASEINVYTNGGDWAMALSNIVNLKPPLGSFGPTNFGALSKKVIWIDCSDVGSTYENDGSSDHGHQYYRMSEPVMHDAQQVIEPKNPGTITPRIADHEFPSRKFVIPFSEVSGWATKRGYRLRSARKGAF